VPFTERMGDLANVNGLTAIGLKSNNAVAVEQMFRSKGLMDSAQRRGVANFPHKSKRSKPPRRAQSAVNARQDGSQFHWQSEDWAKRTSNGTRLGDAAKIAAAARLERQRASPERSQSAVTRVDPEKMTWREKQNAIKKTKPESRPQSVLLRTKTPASRVALSDVEDYSYQLNRRVNPSYLAYFNKKNKSTSQADYAPAKKGETFTPQDAMPYLNSHIGWREPLMCTPYLRKFIIHNPEFKR